MWRVSASEWILDVSEADFERDVLTHSLETGPVVVDFWAPWCGPCRSLGPLLEQLAQEHRGSFRLAKVDVDQAPSLSQHFGVRSIPTVLGIREGRVAAEFQGAQPEAAVRAFLDRLLPTVADQLAEAGEARLAEGDADAAEQQFQAALAQEPRHARALLGLAKLRGASDRAEEALDLLDRVVPGTPLDEEIERLAAALRMRSAASAEPGLEARVAAAPESAAAQLELGRARAAAGRYAEALPALLEAVRLDPEHADQAARKAMLDVFEILGSDHELTQEYRRSLAQLLFR